VEAWSVGQGQASADRYLVMADTADGRVYVFDRDQSAPVWTAVLSASSQGRHLALLPATTAQVKPCCRVVWTSSSGSVALLDIPLESLAPPIE